MDTIFSSTTWLLLGGLLAAVAAVCLEAAFRSAGRKCSSYSAPGPRAWPVIGALHLLAGYELPYQAFGTLAKRYGQVFQLHLGSVPCLVVNGLDNIREVLMTKGNHFDSRPNFRRYHQLFSGDKQNSLAFCDWSEVQKTRREMLRAHTFPRAFTSRFHQLDLHLDEQLTALKTQLMSSEGPVAIKPLILYACANVFTSYFCSRSFSHDDQSFAKMIANFDEIFYEVNQGYAADFIPWLMPLHGRHLAKMAAWSHEIRHFVTSAIVGSRRDAWCSSNEPMDYVDSLVDHVCRDQAPLMSWDTALFALEDIIGGHSAVANLLVKVLGFVAVRPEVQHRVQQEVDCATRGRDVTLADRTVMPYTEAIVLEAIRHIASPIVPHVANQDSTVAGFTVAKDTMIFLNNYDLHMSPDLWQSPERFMPERFLCPEGRLVKPDHFLPFGGGRRSCMGYKMTQLISFATLASLLQRFHILPVEGANYKVPLGNLALPYHTFKFCFQPR